MSPSLSALKLSSLPLISPPSSSEVSTAGHLHGSFLQKAGTGQGHKLLNPSSRSNRIIVFNLPEASLMETKSAIDKISEYLIGKKVNIHNAIRLGKRKPPGNDSAPTRPRPILITLDSDWDKRLLLSNCRNLKGFSTYKKLFLRADLPPDHPQRANRRITETSHQPSQPQAADESHHSDAHYSDAESTGPISDPPVAHHEQ